MDEKEVLKVFVDWRDGETRCICLRSHKRDIVERDLYRDWKAAFKQDKFGRSRFSE